MGYLEAERTALQRWRLFQELKTGIIVLATQVYDPQDKEQVKKYLLGEEADGLLLGDAVILTPEGFRLERFIRFANLYRRVS